MKLSLAIQCISTWDFSPIEDETQITINGLIYPHTVKKGGYRVITKPLPDKFMLSIYSKNFMPFETEITNLPPDKIVLCELHILKSSANSDVTKNSIQLNLNPPATVALLYGYYRIEQDVAVVDNIIKVINPDRKNLEGKRFLLRDTKSAQEEFIILGDTQEIALTSYKIPPAKNAYKAESTALFPAFQTNTSAVCLPRTPLSRSILIYENGQKRELKISI